MITEEETTGISRATLYKYINLRKENQNADAQPSAVHLPERQEGLDTRREGGTEDFEGR